MKISKFQIKYIPWGLIDNISIGSDNGWRQAIIWTNVDIVYWRIYASPGFNVQKSCKTYIFPIYIDNDTHDQQCMDQPWYKKILTL